MLDVNASAASLLVIQNDRVVLEWYDGTHHSKKGARLVDSDSMFNLYSTRKTYVGLATAIAAVEANVPLETPVYPYVNDIPREQLGEITLRDLATKTGAKYFGDRRIEREELAGKIIETITGLTIAELIADRVLNPVQLNRTEWVTSPKENLVCDYQADGKYASVRIESNEGHERNLYTNSLDLGLWGNLHLNKGVINGQRLLPEAVFKLYDQLQSEEGSSKRLFGWYHEEHWYYATGAAGCHCIVLPEYHAVGVRMLNRYTDNYIEDQLLFNQTLLNCLEDAASVVHRSE
ncbi:serine hydrolase [Paenibacillus sp. PR3]|uniref:Serine hydrolase n=2 Tax=Paenibacillus terricola TaxID=2763503 RepID=A0ABR8MTB2_9BACL|nr:serine hydrolase [Paenibacillus terricola]